MTYKNEGVIKVIDSLIAMSMIGIRPKFKSNREVPGVKSRRTTEQVQRLKHEAQKKRKNRAIRNEYNHWICRVNNPCYSQGQPSQEFCKYKERSINGVIKMMPIWKLAKCHTK